MDRSQRYNRDEISRILKRAAELEHEQQGDDESEGLTIDELKQVSREVGLNPRYVEAALDDLQNAPAAGGLIPGLLGGPFTYRRWTAVPGTLSEARWEEAVAEIRRIHGGIGKTSRLGRTFEWEQRKQEVGYIQIALSPPAAPDKGGPTKVRITADYTTYAGVVYTLSGALGLALIGIILDGSTLPELTRYLAGGAGWLGIMTGARFYLAEWMKKKRRTYARLTDRFREMLAPAGPRAAETQEQMRENENKKEADSDTSRSTAPIEVDEPSGGEASGRDSSSSSSSSSSPPRRVRG